MTFWAILKEHLFEVKSSVVTFGRTFEKIGLLFIPISVHDLVNAVLQIICNCQRMNAHILYKGKYHLYSWPSYLAAMVILLSKVLLFDYAKLKRKNLAFCSGYSAGHGKIFLLWTQLNCYINISKRFTCLVVSQWSQTRTPTTFSKMGHSRPLFSLFSSFQYTVDSKQMFNI